jgi:TonB family protein
MKMNSWLPFGRRARWIGVLLLGLGCATVAADAPVSAFGAAFAQWNRAEHKAALAAFQPLAEAGDVRAQVLLGLALLEGKDLPRDAARGFAWLKIAASADVYGYATAAGATARQQIASLGPQLSGADLIAADRISGQYLDARDRDYGVRLKAAALVLTGRSTNAEISTMPGCALDRSIGGCEEARRIADWAHACAGDIMVPDLPATTEGPDAHLVQPEFPPASSSWEGVVLTLAHVDTSGYVCQVALLHGSGRRDVDQAVLNAVRLWRYQPGLRSGTAVESLVEARVENLVPIPGPATPAR